MNPYNRPMLDGRRKLDPARHEEVREKYKELKSYQKAADHFGVSKRLIIFIVNPEKYEQFRMGRQGNWVNYYDKQKRRMDMQKYREKKKKLGFVKKPAKND